MKSAFLMGTIGNRRKYLRLNCLVRTTCPTAHDFSTSPLTRVTRQALQPDRELEIRKQTAKTKIVFSFFRIFTPHPPSCGRRAVMRPSNQLMAPVRRCILDLYFVVFFVYLRPFPASPHFYILLLHSECCHTHTHVTNIHHLFCPCHPPRAR